MSWPAIGEMRHRVVIEEAVPDPDGGGGAVVAWGFVAEVWAAIRPLSGSESAEAQGLTGRITHEVIVRRRAGLGPHLRLKFDQRIFDIKSVIDIAEARRFQRCLVEERVP